MSSPLSASMESILDRFDDAWNGPTPPRIEDYLAEADPDQRLPLLIELVRIDIERRLAAGERVRLEETYQRRFPELFAESTAIVTLVKHEFAVRRRNEPELMPAEYLARFPQCQTELVAQLPTLDEILNGDLQRKTADATAELDLRGYVLIETLGKGGMGEVYRSVDPALGRDLAIKVMKSEYRGRAEAERRFLREARVTGSLQHPGIVPIHNLGRLRDGRLHYTMRLVRGQTFANILQEEAGKPERLPYLLSIFEKICQAVAYAHSKRVIHRDLKPHNVMVGKFGEVQVMDWGLAKVLTPGDAPTEPEEKTDAAGTRIVTESDTPSDLSRAGSGMGTPAYMPPEQALGEWDTVDERADVFALGSILCEILTGQPAYSGTDGNEVYRRAKRGDMTEALQRLQQCGADAALTVLCHECLSPNREERPRDAAVVAKRVAAYQAEVQERLWRAELERVAAETRAREEQARAVLEQERTREALARVAAEQRATRWLLVLAAAVVVVVLVGGAGLAAGLLAVRAEQRRTQGALDQVTAEQQKTQAAWKQTREALNTVTDDVMKELLGKQPVLGENEKAFLRKALGFYEQFAAERGDDEESRAVAAEGQFRVAKLRSFLGENAEAETGYRAAVRLYEKLAADFPAVPQYLSYLARSHHNLGIALTQLGKDGEAETAYRQAIALHERLSGEFPAVPIYRHYIAGNHAALGQLLRRLGKHTKADEAYHEALKLQEKLVAEFPAEPLYRRDLAFTYIEQGSLLLLRGKYVEAEKAYHEALKLQEKMVAEFPAVPDYRLQLANGHRNLGFLLKDLGKWAEAVAAYIKALTLQEKLISEFPLVPEYRNELAHSYFQLGLLLATMRKTAKAEEAHHRALALREKLASDYPAVPEYRDNLALSYNGLGYLMADLGKPTEAEPAYRKALALREKLTSDFPTVPGYREQWAICLMNLGNLMAGLGKHTEADAAHRHAIALQEKLVGDYPTVPRYRQYLAGSYVNFGNLLRDRGKPHDALDCYAKAIPLLKAILAQDARTATARLFLRNAHSGLGLALAIKGRLDEAMAEFRQAIALDPKYPEAHYNLGNALRAKGRLDEAMAEYRQAIALDPKDAKAHNNLGNALAAKGRLDEAMAEWRQAIALDPKDAKAHNNLGNALYAKGLLDEAMAEYRQGIALDPKDAPAHNNLGNALRAKGRLDEAMAEYRQAIALDPKYALAHYNLGVALRAKGRLDEAMAEYRQAIALDPKYAEAHCNLGHVLRGQGRFDEAAAYLRKGHELGSKQPGWRYPSAQWLRDAEREATLAAKLPAILTGEAKPTNPGEAVALASMCQQPYQKRHAASARLYADAFAAEPRLAPQHRYNAACSAALAAAGQGKDARALPDRVMAMFRRWALGWLRDDLAAYTRLAEKNDPKVNQSIQQTLAHWRRDPDLASVRDPQALDHLSEDERAAWQALWRDVDELAKRGANKDAVKK